MRCAFLTMDDMSGWSIDADLAFEPLAELGWQAGWLPWRRTGVDWDEYDAVYLAATWDYPDDTFLLTRERAESRSKELAAAFGGRPFVVQPFLEAVRDEGEYSLVLHRRRLQSRHPQNPEGRRISRAGGARRGHKGDVPDT